MPEEPEDFEHRPAPSEGGGSGVRQGGETDARDAAREEAGDTGDREGEPREGDERKSTGNPAAAGED